MVIAKEEGVAALYKGVFMGFFLFFGTRGIGDGGMEEGDEWFREIDGGEVVGEEEIPPVVYSTPLVLEGERTKH